MRLLIVGAGAIGSFVGSRLARAGHDVTLVGRPGYVDVVRERGVGLEEARQRVYVKNVQAVTHVAQVADESFDLIVFTMKAYDTAEAAAQVRSLARRGIPLLIIQNGVGGEESVAQALGKVTVFSAIITTPVEIVEPGVIRPTPRGAIGLAPTVSGHSVNGLAETFRGAGFKVAVYSHYRAMKWSKLPLNMLGNASSAILGLSPDKVFAHPRLFSLERTAFCEAVTVIRAMDLRLVSLPGYPVPILAWSICSLPDWLLRPLFQRIIVGGRGGKMPSLYLDVARQRKHSEVEYLNGAVVKQARKLGMEVPANEALYSTLMSIVRGDTPWEEHRGQPEKLLAAAGLYGGLL